MLALIILLAPAQIVLTAAERTSTITIVNATRASASYTLSVQSWTHDENGRTTSYPTHELTLSPDQLSLAAGERKSITVSAESFDSKEHAYNVIASGPGAEQTFPVFTQTRKGRSQVWVGDATLDASVIAILLQNHGDAHDLVHSATVTLHSANGEKLYSAEARVGLILPGGARRIVFPQAPDCRGCTLSVAAHVGQEMLNASFHP